MMQPFKDWLTFRLTLFLLCIVSFLSAAEKQRQVFTGTLVDITCATDPKANLKKLRSEHSRKCLLMPVCAESGYALLTDEDKVLRLDTNGNALARRLIQKDPRNQNWRVSVDGLLEADQLNVQRIRLSSAR